MLSLELEDGLYSAGPYFFAKVTSPGMDISLGLPAPRGPTLIVTSSPVSLYAAPLAAPQQGRLTGRHP